MEALSSTIAILDFDLDARIVVQTLGLDGQRLVILSQTELAEGIAAARLDCAIVSGRALIEQDFAAVTRAIAAQPGWSDFPFILLLEETDSPALAGRVAALGNASLLEAPVRADLLSSALEVALRARRRQRQAGGQFAQIEAAESRLRDLAATLEARVRERMGDLRQAHDRLLQEVAERREAERRLRESEELYRYTVELSQQMAWTADPDGTLTYISPLFRALTGITEERADRAWQLAVHPEDLAALLERWGRMRREESDLTAEFRLRMADGGYRLVRSRVSPRRDESGAILRWYGVTEDVEQQHQAERARRVAEERYRLAARATDDAIWDTDLLSDRVHWSGSKRGLFGYSERDTELAWWIERIHPADRERVAANFQRARDTGRSHWSAAYRFMAADGSYADVLDRGFMVRSESGSPVRAVGAMANITERVRAEAALRQLQAELMQVSQTSAMGAVASTLAHELNQPLTATLNYLRGSLRLLSEGDAVDPRVEEALAHAESGARTAASLVQRVREMAGRGAPVTRPEWLRTLIGGAVALALAPEADIALTIAIGEGAEWVKVDAVQMQQVLINLLRNAAEAMHGCAVRQLCVTAAAVTDDIVEIAISDTGHGVADLPRQSLFSPFRSTKADGMGIGLSISRTIVEAHGGRIWADNGAGGGAIFRFTLPRAAPPA